MDLIHLSPSFSYQDVAGLDSASLPVMHTPGYSEANSRHRLISSVNISVYISN